MKHLFSAITVLLASILLLTACTEKGSCLAPHDPVTLTMWHVYGEQADSPMNRLVEEFNATAGMENGVLINVTLMTNSTDIGPKLLAAQKGIAGAGEMPDLLFCHTSNAVEPGSERLADWNDYFATEERASFVDSFLLHRNRNMRTLYGCWRMKRILQRTELH